MLRIDTGLYKYFLSGVPKQLIDPIKALYPQSVSQEKGIVDYQIDITKTSFLRTLLRPQVSLKIDGHQPFNPISPAKLLPSIEWAMNWCVAAYDHTHLLIHCSVVEKNGKVILFPAKSGSGKSTTSSYLALHGWHLFYDEMAVVELATGKIQPVFRPTSLKNNSVDIIRPHLINNPDAHISEVVHDTHKGSIGHLRAHDRSLFNTFVPQAPTAIVFLDYDAHADLDIYEIDQGVGFSQVILNAFNYSVIGEPAFNVLHNIISQAQIYEVRYSDLGNLTEFLEELVDE